MDIIINAFIALGIVLAAYILLAIGCLAIYALGLGGRLDDLRIGFFFHAESRISFLIFNFVLFGLPLLAAFIALYLPPVARLGIAIGAICVMVSIWLSVAIQLEKTMRD